MTTANTLWSQNAEMRSFISQEQVAQIGLFNLNARMYDFLTGAVPAGRSEGGDRKCLDKAKDVHLLQLFDFNKVSRINSDFILPKTLSSGRRIPTNCLLGALSTARPRLARSSQASPAG